MSNLLKLNLGCGKNILPGYINVDKFGEPDVLHDLECFPWPWETNSVEEIILSQILEHLGQTTDIFLKIIQEIYRVCAPDARIHICVPHPRCDDFINDPTHVRPITRELMTLFSKKLNNDWINSGAANSPLALFLDVDFEIEVCEFYLREPWDSQLKNKQITVEEVEIAADRYNNVFNEIRMLLRVIKPENIA